MSGLIILAIFVLGGICTGLLVDTFGPTTDKPH